MPDDAPPPSAPTPTEAPAPAPEAAPVPAPPSAPTTDHSPPSASASAAAPAPPSVNPDSHSPPSAHSPPLAHSPPSTLSTPSVPAAAATTAMAAPAVHHLSQAPTPFRPSSLPQQLKRLAYVVSLVLGGGAVIAGLWSIFLLPLLHATYSARNALALPQSERWAQLVAKLKGIRELAIFPVRSEDETRALVRAHKAELASHASQAGDDEAEGEAGDKEKAEGEPDHPERKMLTGPEDSPKSASISLAEESVAPPPTTSQLHADPSVLGPTLRELASAMEATATTRTSLLSTLEGYTSGLHRELFLSRGASSTPWSKSTSSVGLGTLSANLAKAGGNSDSPLGLPAAKSEEWDAVRREVRAIKGILLNRRNFAPARPVH